MTSACTRLAGLAIVAAALASLSGFWSRPFPDWHDTRAISATEALALGRTVLWIDARSEKDFQLGHHPGAVHLTERAWDVGIERVLTAWQPNQAIVVYCDGGGCRTGHHVAAHLERDLGIPVRVVTGGWATLRPQDQGR